jgi:hypothetical protein
VTPAQSRAVAAHLQHLRSGRTCGCELLCERAAILEAEAGMVRGVAEETAAMMAARVPRQGFLTGAI